MFTLKKPTEAEVIAYLLAQRDMPFSYKHVGATRGAAPAGFRVDRHRVLLGRGNDAYERAKSAIRQWKMFPRPMTELYWPDKPIEQGTIVAMLARGLFLWTLNPCRIVYTFDGIDEESSASVEQFGFAYGTLPDHLECGEEVFRVRWHHESDEVWYEIDCFSKPQHVLSYLGFPLVRHEQARFRRLSGQAMQQAVSDDSLPNENTKSCSPTVTL